MVADDLPLLGEPLAIELANTDYGEGTFDFLAAPEDAAVWLKAVGLAGAHPAAVATLRDAARRLLLVALEGGEPDPVDLHEVNRCLRLAVSEQRLVFNAAGWSSESEVTGNATARALHRLATSTRVLLAGDDRERLRVCAAPDCSMLFVQQHRRRRFCHASCSDRTRQAAFQARRRASVEATPAARPVDEGPAS